MAKKEFEPHLVSNRDSLQFVGMTCCVGQSLTKHDACCHDLFWCVGRMVWWWEDTAILTVVSTRTQEEAVFVLPGTCFGAPNFFRVVFTAPEEKLREAFDRIAAFCTSHLSDK